MSTPRESRLGPPDDEPLAPGGSAARPANESSAPEGRSGGPPVSAASDIALRFA